MIFNEMDVNIPGLDVFEQSTATMPTFVYHGIDHDRSSHGNESIAHESLQGDESPVRLEIRQSIDSEETINQEYIYDFADGNDNGKEMVCEDAEKRRVRRERNKVAASKCRKKRKDHVRNLVQSYEQLEMCNKNLETDIEKLHNEIRELEKMLDTHPCTRLLYTETGSDSLSH